MARFPLLLLSLSCLMASLTILFYIIGLQPASHLPVRNCAPEELLIIFYQPVNNIHCSVLFHPLTVLRNTLILKTSIINVYSTNHQLLLHVAVRTGR